MALLYRAIWDEDRPDLIEAASLTAVEWFNRKGLELDTIPEGDTSGEFYDSHALPIFPTRYELSAAHAAADSVDALRVRFVEHRDFDGQSWTTTFTVLRTSTTGTLWVDVERVSDDPYRRVPFRAPYLVKRLIEQGFHPRVGHVRLESGPRVIPIEGLAGLVLNLDRRLPLVVFSHDRAGPTVTMARARAAFDVLAGVAQVFIVPPEGVDEFKERVGEDLGVWGGAARLYLPNTGPAGLNPRRHRYVSGTQAARRVDAAAEHFAMILAGSVPATPAPPAYDLVRNALRLAPQRDLNELLEHADKELAAKDKELELLRAEKALLEEDYLDLAADLEELAGLNNRLSGQIALVVAHTRGLEGEPEVGIPDEVSTIPDAVSLASRVLSHVVVHEDAPVDIEKLEAALTAGPWANLIWRGLRALHAYAAGDKPVDGNFYEWCRTSGSPWIWPHSDKKLAMHESEGVMNNQRLRAARMLPVSTEVAFEGKIEMVAHLKIATGGGMLAPRIYFFDDTKGATGKVHVGFIGPHAHMPNLSTN